MQDNFGHESVSDIGNTAKSVAGAGKSAVNDGKAAVSAARKAASGNFLGAGITVLSNPRVLAGVLAMGLVIIFIPIVFVSTFVIAFPSSIIDSVNSAGGQTVDSLTLGWERWKAELGNELDDFLTFLTTGTYGTQSVTFKNDIAIAEDPEFSSYVGTSNTLVAVLNNYFRDAFVTEKGKAKQAAETLANSLRSDEMNRGVLAQDISVAVNSASDGTDYSYLNWTFYIMACDSMVQMYDGASTFRAGPMIDAAKSLLQTVSLWEVTIDPHVEAGPDRIEQVLSLQLDPATGEIMVDPDTGDPIYAVAEVRHPTRIITVTYSIRPREAAENYIVAYYNISNAKNGASDMSDLEMVEEEVIQMQRLYLAYGAIGDLVATGTVLQWINDFYNNHSALVFDGPSTVAGPLSDWRNHITSHMGSVGDAGGYHSDGHGGTDVAYADGTPLYLPAKGIIVACTNNLPNVKDDSHSRGNLILVYYGEQNGVAGNGIFVLYQHLQDAPVQLYQTYEAGELVAHCGHSGSVYSSTGGTGAHFHIETYVGTAKLDPESFLI